MKTSWRVIVISLLEKAGWSGGQQFLTVIFGGGLILHTGVGFPWAVSLGTAAGAFVMSFVTSGITAVLKVGALSFWPELVRRVAVTFGQSLMSMWTADSVLNVLNFHWVSALNVAAVTAALALGKGLLSPNARDRLSPSTLKDTTATAVRGTQA